MTLPGSCRASEDYTPTVERLYEIIPLRFAIRSRTPENRRVVFIDFRNPPIVVSSRGLFLPLMQPEASVIEVILESNLANVERAEEAARSVAAKMGFDEEREFHVEMAVHEAVINAIHHGNKENASKRVYIRFLVFADRLEIHVRDEGQGFDPATLPDPLASENILSDSGRGIFLVRKFMDEFRVEKSPAGGTDVIMVKHLTTRIQSNQGGTGREHEGNGASG